MAQRTVSDLRQLQGLPLEAKVILSKQRIREWYDYFSGDVCVSFSGGKDSTVLAHLVHSVYPEVPLVFSNTGLEYPEIQAFSRKMGAEFVRPKMSFGEVITKYGYPIISKAVAEAIYYARRIKAGRKESCFRRMQLTGEANDLCDKKSIFAKEKWFPLCSDTDFMIGHYCCSIMKKNPLKAYQHDTHRYPFLGTQASESLLREKAWINHGCNAFESETKTSQPLSFWTEQDVLRYIVDNGIEIASVYGDVVAVDKNGFQYEPFPGIQCHLECTGCKRTGCVYCAFGAHLDKGKSRFQTLAQTHPKQYEYCIGGGNTSTIRIMTRTLLNMMVNGKTGTPRRFGFLPRKVWE